MQKVKFNHGWVLHEGGGGSLDSLTAGAAAAKPVTLPHDATIEKPRDPQEPNGSGNGFFHEETIHYTKEFMLNPEDEGKNVWLEFEGVYQNTYVYINNSFAGKCPYGYGNFFVDATKYLHFDKKNLLKVVVKNGVPSGRWYTGGGIYRDVNLMIADRLHLVPDGAHLATVQIEDDLAVIRVDATVEYTGAGIRDIVLTAKLQDDAGNVVASSQMPITMDEHTKQTYQQKLYVDDPKLWDVDTPYLYTYRIEVKEGDAILDAEEGTFGIRTMQLDTKHGLRVNGKTVLLRGGCIHHDNGITGTAEFPYTAESRIQKLKEAGFNAVRSTHHPMSRRLLEACDKLGMYVMDEFSDVWVSTKVDFDYGTHLAEWWEHDITNLVNKDYNHPCVLMYSIGNEIPETGNKFDVQWGKKFTDKLRELDDTRYVTNSMNLMLSIMDRLGDMMATAQAGDGDASADAADEGGEINSMMSNLGDLMEQMVGSEVAGNATEEAASQVDITGYNYAACRYEKDGITYPNRILVGSETYPGDLDRNWELVEKLPYLIGDFDWTAFDYLGEAGIGKVTYGQAQGMSFYAPYPYKAAYCGDLNLIGDMRPVAYWRQLIWGLRKAPYVCAQPPAYHGVEKGMTGWSMTDAVRSWNWAGYEGKPITVEVYADADEAALYVNGELIEKKAVGETKKFVALFETVYTPGTLETVVYRKGQEIGRDTMVTASEDVHIDAYADKVAVPADESDICYVEIALKDAQDNLNPGCDKAVTILVEGPGRILGFGSADPQSEENYFDTTAKAYEGRLRAAIRGTGEKGTITVTLKAEGCEDVKVQVEAE